MSIIETLITDRTQADVTKLKSLLSKPKAMWTNEKWSEFLLAKDKGAYNATDLNRVQEAMEYLAERFRGYGYNVPEIKRPSITEVIPGTIRLPEGYTELEYIRSTGEQYINTEFIPNQNSRVVAKIQFAASATTATNHIFGVRAAYKDRQFSFYGYKGVYGSTYGTADNSYSDATSLDTHFVVDKNKGVITINGETFTQSSDDFACNASLYLFATNQGGSAYNPSTGAFYSCQIYDNGTLVRDYVPCLTPSNEVGLYDIVNGVFYGNAGTGYFLPGPAVSLPVGYTRLEHIQSTGTQWINTLYTITSQKIRYVLEFSAASITGAVPVGGGATNGYFPAIHQQTASSGVKVWVGSSGALCQFTLVANQKTTVDLTADNGSLAVTFNGTKQTASYGGSISSASAPSLFTQNANNNATQFATMNLYCFVLYDNDILVRLYTPVLNPDGEIGLYDSVTREFYGNAGTGVFLAGDELGSSDGNIPTQIIERNYWKIGDIPRKEQMELYLTNLGYVKNVLGLLKSTPESPSTMDYLSYVEANNIEQILVDIEFVITHTIQSMARLNAFMFASGYRPFPSSASDYGRTWDDIDALELNWDDLDDGEAWYTMQYGVIK